MNAFKKLAYSFGFALALLLGVVLGSNFYTPDVQAQGGVTGFSSVRVTGFYREQPRTVITVTANSTINTTGGYQRLAAASAVGTSGNSLVVEPAGTLLTLVNVGSNTITITETANMVSAGNVALGAGDSATFLSDGADWYQVAGSNN